MSAIGSEYNPTWFGFSCVYHFTQGDKDALSCLDLDHGNDGEDYWHYFWSVVHVT